MITFKLDGKEYKINDHLTINHYSQIFKVQGFFDDEHFAGKLINIVSGAPVKDLMDSDYQEIQYLASYILSLIPQEKPKFVDRFELDGVHYGFFPNWREISFAEFIDMDTISTKKPEELSNLLHILAAIMYRPIVEEKGYHDFKIEKYNVESMKKRAELFKDKLDIKYILGAQFFFIKFAKRYSSYIQLSSIRNFSIWMKIKLLWRMRKILWTIVFKRRSVGSLSSTELLTMILQSTNISMKSR